jgi:hypothetical protein
MCIKAKTDFDLVNVDILVLLLHLPVGDFHCADRRHLPGIQAIVSFGISAASLIDSECLQCSSDSRSSSGLAPC